MGQQYQVATQQSQYVSSDHTRLYIVWFKKRYAPVSSNLKSRHRDYNPKTMMQTKSTSIQVSDCERVEFDLIPAMFSDYSAKLIA